MTEEKKSCCKVGASKCGSKIVVVLVIAAVGIFAYKSGKLGMVKVDSSASSAVEDVTAATPERAKNPNPVLAKLYGEEIKRQDVLEFVNAMPQNLKQMPVEHLFSLALEQIINNKIVDKNAGESGLENDPAVKEQLAKITEQIVRTKFLENAVKAKLTEERLKARYEEYLESFPDVEEVKVAHILVDNEKLAKELIGKLKKGMAFADLAKENSQDGSAENGGDLGYFSKTDVVPAFAEAAFALEAGTYSKVPVKTDFGFHIIKVDEKRKRPPAEFADVKPYMEQELQRAILDEMIEELRADVEIERFDINGKPLAKTEPAAGADKEDASESVAADQADVSTEDVTVESVTLESVAPEASTLKEESVPVENAVE